MGLNFERTVKNGIKFNIEAYNSAKEVVEDCRKRPITNPSFDDMTRKSMGSFEAVKDYDEALHLLEFGYQPTVDEFKKKLTNAAIGEGKRITFKNDIAGYAPIVPLALKGVPNSMISTRMKPIKSKVIDIYYDITCSCGTDSKDIIANGSKILGAIIKLEAQGYRFNLYAMQVYYNDKSADMLVVKIKSANQPIDLKRISFPLTHTAFFRVIGFDWYSKTPKGKYRSGYGHALSYDYSTKDISAMMQEIFGAKSIFFAGAKILSKGQDHIEEVIINASNNKDK